jgi:lysozyme
MNIPKKSLLSAAVLALVAAGASQTSILDQFIKEKESSERYELKAYQDGARVWTVCDGKTAGVTASTVMTKKQCDDWRRTEIGRRLTVAHKVIKVPMSESAWAGFGSFCWNIGDAGCSRSTTAKLINEGRHADGCKSMLNWRYITRDGRKVDCSEPNPYCSGLWDRRNGEAELCSL